MKRDRGLILLFVCAAGTAPCMQAQSVQKFDAGAIFQPGMSEMQAARETCSKAAEGQFSDCFVQQMQKAGASPQAVAFMHAIQNNGFMRDFKNTGRVDIAFALFPFAANENEHCLLVNGVPSPIDVDDYKLLPKGALAKNTEYSVLLRKFPNVAVFPGDRSGTKFITAIKLRSGGQRFLVPYVLVDGCHACARTGTLQLAFDFDSSGRFLGTKVASVKPLPERTQ